MKNRFLSVALGCSVVLGAVACGSSAPAPPPATIDSDVAVATFDSVWATIDRSHFDPDFEGVDWAAVRDELRPRASEVETNHELRVLLDEMIGRLGLSHFGIIQESALDAFGDDDPDGSSGYADVGIEVRLVDDDVLVWRVREDSPAAAAGVGTGWIVASIDGRDLRERIDRARESMEESEIRQRFALAAPRWMQGASGDELELGLIDGDGAERTLSIEREVPPGTVAGFGNLPPMRSNLTTQERTVDGRRVGVIEFNIWLLPVARPFDAAIDSFRQVDGIVLDLRGNLGGIGAMSMNFAGHFLTERLSLGVMSTRTTRLEFKANPRKSNAAGQRVEPFAGPVAILVDGLSMSTTEIFAQGLKVLGRARIFGQKTPGAALPSTVIELPNGDGLQYAFADFVDPEGMRLEKNGVVPHEIVPLTRDDLLAGRDAPMEAALQWIADQSPSPRARR